jgi:hypothetical protein
VSSLDLNKGHRLAVLATVTDSTGVVHTVEVDDGTITADATAAIRRRCENVIISDPSLAPATSGDLLAPVQNEITLSRGYVLPSGTVVLSPLGVFAITESRVSRTKDDFTVVLSGYDRSKVVQDNTWDGSFQPASAEASAMLRTIITNRYPAAQFNFAPTGFTVPALTLGSNEQSNDPWQDCLDIATAAGSELFVDPNGIFTLRPPVDPTTAAPSWSYGDAAVKVLSVDMQMQRDKSYTRVVGYAQSSTGSPLRSVADSGVVPARTYVYNTTAATTQAQLDAAVAALLTKLRGAYTNVTFTAIPDPSLDVGTAGQITRADMRLAATSILDQLTIGLKEDAQMTGVLRGQNLGS